MILKGIMRILHYPFQGLNFPDDDEDFVNTINFKEVIKIPHFQYNVCIIELSLNLTLLMNLIEVYLNLI